MCRFKKIFVGSVVSVLMFTLVVPPASAQSATTVELQAQIAILMAQIAALNGGNSTPIGNPAPAQYVSGDRIITTATVRVRTVGSLIGQELGRQAAGSVGIVTSGPITTGGHTWYRINFDTGVDGWVASSWLARSATRVVDVNTFVRTNSGNDNRMKPGQEDASIVNITVQPASFDRYANKVVLQFTPASANSEDLPWVAFEEISLWANGWNIRSVDAGYSGNWRPVGNSYEINVFSGNEKINPHRGYNFVVAVTSDDDTPVGDRWTVTAPAKGVVIWSQQNGHMTNAAAMTAYPIEFIGTTAPKTITVTAPNGGEKWEIGVTNTVTWRPYGYNPDVNPARDVTAYLETKNADGSFKNLGKVQESGKASIHWPTGELNLISGNSKTVPAGDGYYVRVVNDKTGASDRSDRPFTLLAKSADLKINGSDGPVKVALNEKVTATWKTTNVKNCELRNAYKDTSRTAEVGAISLNGSMPIYLHLDPLAGPTLYCTKNDGSKVSDNVYRTAPASGSQATVKIISPNGGEKLDPARPLSPNYVATGVSSISMALYKNDMWKAWIVRDLVVQTGTGVDFIPNVILQGLGEGDNKDDIFKLYIVGKKADNSGFVEDKSDRPFQFTVGASTTNTFTLTDVSKVTKQEVDNTSALDDAYTIYTITLKDKMVKTLKIPVRSSADMRIRFAKEVGFSGSGSDLEKLLALATVAPQVRYDLPKTKTAFVQYLYRCVLDRTPDPEGLARWTDLTSPAPAFYKSFFNSPEFNKKNLNNPQFVDKLYQCVLFREAEQAGKNGWVARLAAGDSRLSVLEKITASTEYTAKIKPTLDKLVQTTLTPPTPPVASSTGQVLGASADIYSQIVATLEAIKNLLKIQ